MNPARKWRLGFAGFGHVNRALARLLLERREELKRRHGIAFEATLVATVRRGAWADAAGIDLAAALRDEWPPAGCGVAPDAAAAATLRAIETAPIDLLFEATPLDPRRGEPAISFVRAALSKGIAVVSANKGPVAFAAAELFTLARQSGAGFRFESAVADCLPVFDLVEMAVPVGRVLSFRGVLNSTSNMVLQAVTRGVPLADAIAEAQRLGLAEADPSHDLDGWDQAVKAVILANVILGRDIRPTDVERTPLLAVDLDWVRGEESAGRTVRLAAEGSREGPVRVAPVALPAGRFLASLPGGSLGLEIETELAGRLQVGCVEPRVEQTAYGMLTDLVAIHQGRRAIPFPPY